MPNSKINVPVASVMQHVFLCDNRNKEMGGVTNYERILLLHVSPLVLIGILISALYYWAPEPAHRTIECTDKTINLRYADSTVTSPALYSSCTILPLASVILLELLHNHYRRYRYNYSAYYTDQVRKIRLCHYVNIHPVARIIHIYILTFAVGALANILVTDVIKYGVGRPRPHFLKLCAPYACTQNNATVVDTHFLNCTNPHITPHLKNNLRLSFISGHSSMAAYAATFLILYLSNRGPHIWIRNTSVLTYTMQTIVMCGALFIGLSRIWDHKHHYQDVACGLIEGTISAYIAWNFLVPTLHKDMLLTELYEDMGSNPPFSPLAGRIRDAGMLEFPAAASSAAVAAATGLRGVRMASISSSPRMPNI